MDTEGTEIVAVLVDGKFTPSPFGRIRTGVPGLSQALTTDNRVLTISPEDARELARLLKGRRSVRIEER